MWDWLIDAVAYLIRDTLWESVLFTLGRLGLLAVTLGRFPRGRAVERHADLISLAGVIVVILAWLALAWWNQHHGTNPLRTG